MNERRPWPLPARGSHVYLVHLEQPRAHARHYIGWSQNLPRRIAHHRAGNGARLLAAVSAAGGRYVVARVWTGTRTDERRLHRAKCSPRLCPICTGRAHACFGCGRVYRYPGWLARHRSVCTAP